jgi:hypothetical protein
LEDDNKNIASSLAKLSHHPLSQTIFNSNKNSLISIESSQELK